jgi:hypothetical protein
VARRCFSISHHHVVELLKIHLSVAVNVRLEHHLVELVVGEVDAEPGHDKFELRAGHVTVAVLVEDAKGLPVNVFMNDVFDGSLKFNLITCFMSSLVRPPHCFFIMRPMNSGKLMLPLPSSSASSTISSISSSSGFWPKRKIVADMYFTFYTAEKHEIIPRDRMTVPSSLVLIVPSPSLSNIWKHSLNSSICCNHPFH